MVSESKMKKFGPEEYGHVCVDNDFRGPLGHTHYKGPFTPSVNNTSEILLQIKCNVVVQLCNDAPEWVATHFQASPLISM